MPDDPDAPPATPFEAEPDEDEPDDETEDPLEGDPLRPPAALDPRPGTRTGAGAGAGVGFARHLGHTVLTMVDVVRKTDGLPRWGTVSLA